MLSSHTLLPDRHKGKLLRPSRLVHLSFRDANDISSMFAGEERVSGMSWFGHKMSPKGSYAETLTPNRMLIARTLGQ